MKTPNKKFILNADDFGMSSDYNTAICFYRLMNLLGVKIPLNHSDFRLVSRKGLDILEQYQEEGLFLRGFFHEIGLKTAYVHFNVKPRALGSSKFNFF